MPCKYLLPPWKHFNCRITKAKDDYDCDVKFHCIALRYGRTVARPFLYGEKPEICKGQVDVFWQTKGTIFFARFLKGEGQISLKNT